MISQIKLHAFVKRGTHRGVRLFPHKYEDGKFVVSKTRFAKDYKRVSHNEILKWLEAGYGLRMSNIEDGIKTPSWVQPESIYRPVSLRR